MPTYVTTNAGGTPQTRLSSLLESTLSSLDESSPAYSSLREAHKLSTGQEDYLEEMTGDLIIPKTHSVTREEVEKVWIELLRKTEETDWKKLKVEGKTQWELSVGMVSYLTRSPGLRIAMLFNLHGDQFSIPVAVLN